MGRLGQNLLSIKDHSSLNKEQPAISSVARATLPFMALSFPGNLTPLADDHKVMFRVNRSNCKAGGNMPRGQAFSSKGRLKGEMGRKAFLVIWTALLLWSCATPISEQTLMQADPGITFGELIKDPEEFKGRVVLLGGQILSTIVKESGTWVEVVQKPLDRQHEPKDTDDSEGRFVIDYADFRDPAIYAKGRKITVVGEVLGKRTLPLNEIQYTYPVLTPRETHLWKPRGTSEPGFHFGIGIGGVF
jgi:outer membrane lipoprotein